MQLKNIWPEQVEKENEIKKERKKAQNKNTVFRSITTSLKVDVVAIRFVTFVCFITSVMSSN